MANKLILYNLQRSPGCRTVRIVAKLLGIELELREVVLLRNEQMKPEFLKMNPEHTVPTLDDNGFIIWDSHAIITYLCDKYGKDDKLYPKDLQLRAKCNQRLLFDQATFVRVRDVALPFRLAGATEVPKEKLDLVYAAYDILEAFLATDLFLVGNNFTVADIPLSLTIPFLDVFAPVWPEKYPKIIAWLKRVRNSTPFFAEVNQDVMEDYHNFMQGLKDQNIERQKQQQHQ